MRTTSSRRFAAGIAVAIAVLAATAGATAGPAAAEPAAGMGTAAAAPPDIREVELTVRTSDGLALPATLRSPTGVAPGGPAMVMVHGAGTGPRDKYRAEAEAFTRAGITTLSYEKRSAGYSQTERSYSRLADDAVAAVDLLRTQPGVDPADVGLWGISEGGWVAPLAASRAPGTAFLVVVGANGVQPLRQQTWADALKVQLAGVQGSLVDAASSGSYRLINSMGLFPEPYYDPAPVLRGLTLPVLGIWGAVDRATPAAESAAAFRTGLDAAGNRHYLLQTFDRAEHSLHPSVDGFAEDPGFAPGYAELIGSWTRAAVAGQAPASSVVGSAQQPRQTVEVPPSAWYESAPAHGVAIGLMLAGFVGFGIAAAARRLSRLARDHRPGATTAPEPVLVGAGAGRPSAGGSAGAVRPAATRVPPIAAPVSARVLATTGLATVLGTLVYLGILMMTRGGHAIDPGPLLLGRTLPWLALQALAVTAVAACAVLVVRLVRGEGSSDEGGRSGGERVRLTMLLVAGVLLVPWSLYWGLLVP
jgi:dienelactone hydrolase